MRVLFTMQTEKIFQNLVELNQIWGLSKSNLHSPFPLKVVNFFFVPKDEQCSALLSDYFKFIRLTKSQHQVFRKKNPFLQT